MTDVSPGNLPLSLGSMTIRNVPDLQSQLGERLDESGTVLIDASGAERVDTAILQLLAAFVRDLRADARAVEWSGCSPALRRAAEALGLVSALGLAPDNS